MRTLRKWLFRIALALCVLLVGVLVSAESLLNLRWARGVIRERVQALAGSALETKLEIDHIDSISLSHVRLGGVRLFDRKGRAVATAARVDATLNPWLLIGKRLRLPTLTVQDAYVDLDGLLSVFAAMTPTKAPAEQTSGGLHVELPRVVLSGSRVDIALGDERLSARAIATEVGVDVADEVAVELRALRCDLVRGERALGGLRSAHGTWSSTGAAAVTLDALLAGATLNAQARLGDERAGEQALSTEAHVRDLSADTLATLGVDGAWLTNAAALDVVASGTTHALDYTLAVQAAPLAEAHVAGHVTAPGTDGDTALVIAIDRARYQGTALPRVDARGRWNDARGLLIEHFEAAYAHAELTAHGQVNPDGGMAVIAHLRSAALQKVPVVASALPQLSGALDADVDLTRQKSGAMRAKLQLGLRQPAFGDTARAERLHVSGIVRGASADDVQGDLQLQASALHVGDVDIADASVRAAGSPTRAAVAGRFGDKGRFDLALTRDGPHLGAGGEVHLVVDGKGNVLDAVIRELRYTPGGAVSVREARLAYQNARAQVSGTFDPEHDSDLRVSVHATDLQAVSAPWTDTPLVGALDVDAHARGKLQTPDLEVDAHYHNDTMLGDRRLPTRVALQGTLHVEGTRKAPVVETHLHSELLFRNDLGPLRLAFDARYADSQVDLKLEAEDSHGPLVRTHVQTGFEHAGFKRDSESLSRLLVERAWQAELWLGARRIDQLPGVRSIDVPKVVWPAQFSADAKFAHEPGKEPEGKLTAHMVWDPPGREEGVLSCGMSRRPELQVEVKMENGDLRAQLDASVDKRRMLSIGTGSHAPIDEWLRAKPERVQPADIWLKADELRLQDVPIVCEHATGLVSGTANLKRALLEQVEAEVDLRARDVKFADAPPFQAEIAAHADRTMLVGSAKIHAAHGDALVAAKLPIDGSGRVPTLSLDEPAQADVQLRNIDARALLGAVSAVRTSGGAFGGQIGMRGSIRSPTFKGVLNMSDVSITLAEAGQRFEHVTGKVALDGRHLHLYPTRVHDRDGSVEVSGDVTLIDLTSWQAELKAKAKRFRVRRSGVVLALFDGTLGLTASVDPKQTSLDMTIDDARVELTGESLAGVQSLDPHADIEFVDDLPQPEKPKQNTATATPVVLRVESKKPFWIRREDFSALVSTQLRIEVRDGNSSVSGHVDIDRGYVELLGTMFDIDQGKIEFTGARQIEPTLDLVAKHRSPGGATVTIQAKGPVYDPELTFLVDGQPATAGEALSKATGIANGAGSDATVQGEMSSMATGIAGSMLTLGARRELGDWVPVLGIERGENQTRVRAGIEADRFIPKFLRKIVVDAYVEGIYDSPDTSTNSTDQNGAKNTNAALQSGAGVLLELRFPKQLVGEAQYGPGQQWSLDLSWQP